MTEAVSPNTPSLARWLQRVTYVVLPAALAWASLTIKLSWDAQWAGPFQDVWEFIPFLNNTLQGGTDWQDWWDAYGGAHRVVLTKLLLLLDYGWLGGQNRITLITAWLCQLGIAGLLWHIVLRRAGPTMALLGLSLSLFCLFSPTQLFNFNYAFDVQWFLAAFGVCLTLALTLRLQEKPRPSRLLMLLVAAGLTTLTNFAGLLVWPALILLGLLIQLPRRYQGLLIGSGTIAFSLYLYRMIPNDPESAAAFQKLTGEEGLSLFHLARASWPHTLPFLGRYLSSPLSRDWPLIGMAISGLTFSWLIWQSLRLRNIPVTEGRIPALFITLALYVVLVGLATAMGRSFLTNLAVAERFQTMVMLYWLALGHLTLLRHSYQKQPWAVLAIVSLVIVFVPDAIKSAQRHMHLSDTTHLAHTGIHLGMTEMAVSNQTLSIPAIYEQNNYVARYQPLMEMHQWPPFQSTPVLDTTLSLPDDQYRPNCFVTVSRSQTLAAHAHRRFWGKWRCPEAHTVVLTDNRGNVLGQGRLPLWPAWQFPERPHYPWSGYSAIATPNSRPWRAVLLDHAGQPLAASRPWSP